MRRISKLLLVGICPVILLLSMAGTACAGEAQPADPGQDKAHELKNARDAAEEAVLKAMLTAEERRARARQYVVQGERMLKAERYGDAQEAYEKALRLDPTNAQARRGRDLARRYVRSRSSDRAGLITREINRVKVSAQHSLMEARNHIEKAEALLQEARKQPDGKLPLAARAGVYERQRNGLDQAREHLLRARLLLAGLSARIDTRADRDRIATLGAQIKQIYRQKGDNLASLNNVIAAKQKHDNLVEVRRHVQRQKRELLNEARLHKEMRHFEKAEKIVREVLVIDPSDQDARSLLGDIMQKRRYHREVDIRRHEQEERKRVLDKIEQRAIPDVRPEYLIKYPPNWETLVKAKAARLRRGTEEDGGEAERKIRRRLGESYNVDFVDTPIEDVVAYLRTMSGVNIIYKPGGEDVPPITLSVRNMRLENILKWVMNLTNLNYQIKDEVIYITTAAGLTGKSRPMVYDVRDIAYAVTDARSPASWGDDDDDDDDDDGGESITLAEVVQKVLASYFAGGNAEVDLDDRGNLTVTGTPELQEKVRQLLQKLRTAQAIQVSITARFMTVTDDFWEELESSFNNFDNYVTGASGKGRDPTNTGSFFPSKHFNELSGNIRNRRLTGLQSVMGANLGTSVPATAGLALNINQVGFLNQIQTSWLVRLVKESAEADELFAPHIVVYNNRRGWIRWETEIHYVRTYQQAQGGTDLEGTIDTLNVGTLLEVRPTVSADKRYITVDLHPRVRQLLALDPLPIEGTVTRIAIDLPTVFEHEARTYATMPDGGSVLISGLAVNVHMQGRHGVPLIQDLPLIGNVFSRRASQKERRSFVIVCNGRMILLDEEEAKQTSR